MSYLLSVKHPGQPIRTHEYIQLNEVLTAYHTIGMIPGGFKHVYNGDFLIRMSDPYSSTPEKNTEDVGKYDAYTYLINLAEELARDVPSGMNAVMLEAAKSSIRNANDLDTLYAKGIAEVMRLEATMIVKYGHFSKIPATQSIGDLQTIRRALESKMREATA